ncbi:U2 small nuclear ribonucleoprotein auxiliary factor subunit-related protein 1, putative isoform 1 [Cinnamomum micranthum f. kanehirae]|uniref:U2 small nuclear ribonucleoprotein auxiliary factor subunit-related protein 1, putative isoform 1 n=1 Tax=Cinnamomum micranthum f. kanehirae TaxID=337451 RepID=A0A443PPU1_9MAGN|nr:U2 small nuclear ribonucleoprotein auxiliary factor subunit-related protein 1, putative isoform 1 [Cinnamomum micranthum f. kanehirae]
MGKGLEDLQPVLGEAKAEWNITTPPSQQSSLSRFIFYVHAIDSSRLRIHASDFRSYTWESIRTVQQLEDLRDVIGIGGSWSEFVAYLIASLSSDNVKLVVGGVLDSTGATSAKLVAHKSKGMPLISIPLGRLMNSSADDAKSNLSFELFNAYKGQRDDIVREQERTCQLTKMLHAEREKSESIQRQLDAVVFSSKRKHQKFGGSDKAFPMSDSLSKVDTAPFSEKQSSDKPSNKDPHSMKVGSRVVPAYRRAKVRGVVLQDDDDN